MFSFCGHVKYRNVIIKTKVVVMETNQKNLYPCSHFNTGSCNPNSFVVLAKFMPNPPVNNWAGITHVVATVNFLVFVLENGQTMHSTREQARCKHANQTKSSWHRPNNLGYTYNLWRLDCVPTLTTRFASVSTYPSIWPVLFWSATNFERVFFWTLPCGDVQ